ncbi:unnamed protein product, partial [Candidula unifasciata]
MNNESSSKFISALVKALQTLCHGYIEFNDGIEIIGHIYLNIDSGSSFDYVVKEKLCKSTENSTVFVSKSFQAQAPLDECLTRKDKNDHATEFDDAPDMSPTTGTTRIASAITSISNVLSGAQDSQRSRLLDHSSLHPLPQNTGKRKREHNGSYGSLQPPVKYTTLQASSSSSSPYFSSEPSSKLPADRNHSEHFHASAHGEFFGADSNPSSGMGADEEDDLHLDVTFVKEEYQRNSSHRGAPASAASRLNQDLPSNHSHMLHDGTSGVGALGYSSGHHQGSHFASGTAGDIGSINDSFHDTSQVDIGHNAAQGPPNPRTSMTLQDPSSANRQDTTPSPEGSAFDLSATSHFSSHSFPRQKGIELVHTSRQTKWAVARAR